MGELLKLIGESFGGLSCGIGLEVLTEDETGAEIDAVVLGGSPTGEHLGQAGVFVSK